MVHDGSLLFGYGINGTVNTYATGTVYWSKLWYADLGAEVCKQLACWPHEEIGFEVCYEVNNELKRYDLSESDGWSSITFVASNLLSQPMSMSNASTNAGGWAVFPLNNYLNTRVYRAFSDKWRQLIKKVIVKSSVGNMSSDIAQSNCYIFIPSISELGDNVATPPYASEGTQISHFTNASSRMCESKQYWTRSPSTGWSSYVYSITSNGASQAVTQLSTKHYIRMMISM